jgi:hypothetical protein
MQCCFHCLGLLVVVVDTVLVVAGVMQEPEKVLLTSSVVQVHEQVLHKSRVSSRAISRRLFSCEHILLLSLAVSIFAQS